MAQPYVVKDLTVQGDLQTATQVGGGLTLEGADIPIPLVVNTGAAVVNIFATPLLECLGNLHVAGTLSASVEDHIFAPSADVSGEVLCSALSTAPFSYDFYVAPGGNDASGNGVATNPFNTIQRALTQVEVTFGTGAKTIHLAPGTYTENIFINSCVSIVSLTPNAYACSDTTIAGNVTVAILRGSTHIEENIVGFNGVRITGSVVIEMGAFDVACTHFYENCFFEFEPNEKFNASYFNVSDQILNIVSCIFIGSISTSLLNNILLFITGRINAYIKDSHIELHCLNVSYVPIFVSWVVCTDCRSTNVYNTKVLLYISTVLPTFTDLALMIAGSPQCFIQNCVFEVLSDGTPTAPYYSLTGVQCGEGLVFDRNTFNVQYPAVGGVALIASASPLITAGNNIIMPGSLSVVNTLGQVVLPSF